MWKLDARQKDEVVRLYVGGVASTKIAEQFAVSAPAVLGIVKRRGVTVRDARAAQKKCTIDSSAFSVITEHSAYWAGFLMADGCIQAGRYNHGEQQVSLVLGKKDEQHIRKFRAFLKSSHAITNVPSTNCCRLSFGDDRIANDLRSFGVTADKTHIARVIRLHNNRHFWRGCIDGDGYIARVHVKAHFNSHPRVNAWCKPRDQTRLELVGARPLMEQFLAFVKTLTPRCRANVRPHKSIFTVAIGAGVAERVIDELYSNCSIALDRKQNAARNILARAKRCPLVEGILVH